MVSSGCGGGIGGGMDQAEEEEEEEECCQPLGCGWGGRHCCNAAPYLLSFPVHKGVLSPLPTASALRAPSIEPHPEEEDKRQQRARIVSSGSVYPKNMSNG